MKKYVLCAALFLISTQSYSLSLLRKAHFFYLESLFKKRCSKGDLQGVQELCIADAPFSMDKGLQLLESKKSLTEEQKAIYDLVSSLMVMQALHAGDCELVKYYDEKGYSLWMAAQNVCTYSYILDPKVAVFEYIASRLSVEERSLLLKQLVKCYDVQPPKDKRIEILFEKGVVPYVGTGINDQRKKECGALLFGLWKKVSVSSIGSYCAAVEGGDTAVALEAPVSQWVTLMHFARSCEGRSAHLRKYPRRVPDNTGKLTVKYEMPTLKELAFDAFAKGLSEEKVVSLNELTVANRRS